MSGFGAMLAEMLPEALRYDDRARAVCLRLEWLLDALAPVRPEAEPGGAPAHSDIDPALTANLARSA